MTDPQGIQKFTRSDFCKLMAQVTCAARSTNATLGDGMEGMIRGTSLMEPCFFFEQFPKARSNGPSLRNRIAAEIDIDTSHDLPKSLQIYDHDVIVYIYI